MKKLPRKLSTLLLLAVEDALACQRQRSKYVLDMTSYHDPMGGKCHVCLAGAVMARSLRADDPPAPAMPGCGGDAMSDIVERLRAASTWSKRQDSPAPDWDALLAEAADRIERDRRDGL